MRLTRCFDHLLTTTVDLPKGKLERLGKSVDAVYGALWADDELPVTVLGKIPQGSWAHKTIINPRKQREFDADFLLELEQRPEWEGNPRAYRDEIIKALRRHHRYGVMPLASKCRCVRVTYAGDFHLDVVPVVRRGLDLFIVNADDNVWEATNPTGFTEWFNAKNRATGGNLRRVLRLLKYVRDGSDWRGTRSVLLTILVSERVQEWHQAVGDGYYADVPTTFVHLLEDLDRWLQDRPDIPPMPDPSGSGTSFDHRWDQPTYERLRERINDYAATARAAYDEHDEAASLRLWQEILGEAFQPPPSRAANPGPFGPVPATPGRSGRAG